MGGSTPVALSLRVQVWLETVPALLRKLNVEHVSLMSHSAGTIYCLNTLYHLRDILDPMKPYVAMIGPWVHYEHSNATLMNLASKVPNGMLDSWNGLNKVINERVVPSVLWSGGMFSAVAGLFQSGEDGDRAPPGEKYGTSDETAKAIEALMSKYFFAEGTTAGNEDAKLCLKKDPSASWGVCEDYEEYVRNLVEQESGRAQDGDAKLNVHVFFAESDMMIGMAGERYFERCWRQAGVSDHIEYESTKLPGTDHDSALIDHRKGALKSILEAVKTRSQQAD
ncbi:hypothetical protein LTR37_015347 [Vermiconidia calcicola]|uniref:Uncharacterized protein n=1 Tax=Vermiconidia calcicola TaxID=1690605 RepID=A0ACC3MSJ7_9PEZI|nr:hypothetical protein LTR37_015347 [Vermiconidia calcicola]